ncbi:hypothetical protein BCY89_27345 [Sphingobacterium siyangense]|uniref:Uncharacterized protein n=1 Tax=Sphingobacterium siyangense TaxID=459529 RepID=A0A420FXQ9_9SPHI|nr:hypothetical protein BCY89_27345 [Sphingobacterium siyangense]
MNIVYFITGKPYYTGSFGESGKKNRYEDRFGIHFHNRLAIFNYYAKVPFTNVPLNAIISLLQFQYSIYRHFFTEKGSKDQPTI